MYHPSPHRARSPGLQLQTLLPAPKSWGRLDNIVGPTQDTRKGPNGRKLDAPGRPTDGTNAAHRSTGTPPIRYLANTGSLNHPYDASRIGTRPTPSQPPTASTACPSVRGAVVCCYTHYPASLQKAGHRVTATQQKISGHLKNNFHHHPSDPSQGKQITP